jgi:hypothetical protein
MKIYLTRIILLLIISTGSVSIQAQSQKQREILANLKKISLTVTGAEYIQFDVRYTCANEISPAVILDSLSGRFRYSGNRYWYSVAETEAVSDGSVTAVVFKEDKLIYLSKANSTNILSPSLALIDSLVAGSYKVECERSMEKSGTRYTVKFTDQKDCKKLEMLVDEKLNRLVQVRQVVRSKFLYDESVGETRTPDEWIVVDMRFSNYSKDTGGVNSFDISRYVTRTESGYTPAKEFDMYSVYYGNLKF